MGKINVLEKHIAELIAAGEVVERPSSVIKELVENSIDAGASSVTVEIQHGGTTFMRVTDNGGGIAREDVPKAFLRHATSKVNQQEDLDHIGTLGFRGEALASICAVSRVTLLTRTAEELAGTRYQIDGGESELGCEDAGCAQGTTLVVRDLFYNTPARMKFLKKDVSESNAVAGVMDRMALSHPEVAFRFIRDGKEELNTPGDGKLKSSVYAVYGKEFTNGLIPVSYELKGVKVDGFISKPSATRPNRSMQHFFINGRYVKSRTAMVALEEAFKGSIMVGKFPSCVLHLHISCEAVDVNVHPAKIEVRFINERPIFDTVYHGVKSALMAGDKRIEMPLGAVKPSDTLPASPQKREIEPQEQALTEARPTPEPSQEQQPLAARSVKKITLPEEEQELPEVTLPPKTVFQNTRLSDFTADQRPIQNALENKPDLAVKLPIASPEETEQERGSPAASQPPAVSENYVLEQQEEKPLRLIGEAFRTYILVQRGENELLLIDKHAAHERMLYEKLRQESGKSCAQLLLEPVAVTLDKNEYAAVLENLELLAEAGLEAEDFGGGTVLVRSAPLFLEGTDIASTVMEIAGYLLNHKRNLNTEHLDWLYHNIACRAAVKAGALSKPQELIDLAQRLEQNPDIRYCPHGRPVSIVIKKREIEKQFGRA